jgi:Uma2 family endonuclease
MEAQRTPARTRWTYAEFARLPSEGGARNEIIDGELFVTPAPATRHQQVVTELAIILGSFVKEHALGRVLAGPIDVLFTEGDYVEPDLVFVARDHQSLLSDRGIEGPPDLVVEVLSPSTERRDRGIKLERYRHFGVGEYWIVDADRGLVEVWKRGAETVDVVRETLVWQVGDERLEIALDDVFRP